MKKICSLLILIAVFGVSIVTAEGDKMSLVKNVRHFYQSTILIQGEKTVCFDPVQVPNEINNADVVFVTHTHGDHFSLQDIKKVMRLDATLVIPTDGVTPARNAGIQNVLSVQPNQDYEVAGLKFQTVPAYNINKNFHPKQNNWVGYIVKLNKVTYYIAGDTDFIPEMKNIKADVVFLPVGGTYTTTAKEAAEAANIMKPAVAVPIHFGDVVGSMQDAKDFIGLLDKDIQGIILKGK
jgi:L-ascorbate metabolism protein UlaG (beta-lactamase superfamily)